MSVCRKYNVKSCSVDQACGITSFEFFPQGSAAPDMPLDAKELAKVFTDSMPPDSAMLFAATEDPAPEPEPKPEQGENSAMIG